MHIIKITPQSFKIILTKEDLARDRENITEETDISEEFFRKIINETNRLYNNPFAQGTIDAEFFASRDGGGELFISRVKENKNTNLAFVTSSSDCLTMLCKRLAHKRNTYKSTLYHNGEKYTLVIMGESDGILLSLMKEYGDAKEISPFFVWALDEHEEKIICDDAIGTIAERM